MRKILLFSIMMMASTAWALGGGGSGRQPNFYGNGVSAIGVHFGGDTAPACTLKASDCPGGVDTANCVCESTAGQTCTSHTANQCGLGYYCQFSPYDCDDTKGGNPNGVCTPVGSGTPLKDGAYLKGPETDWWSAYSWCIGNGMDLVTGTIAGKALNSYYSTEDCDGSLRPYFGQDIYFWTGHDYGDSCNAWFVVAVSEGDCVGGDYVGGNGRETNRYALCE